MAKTTAFFLITLPLHTLAELRRKMIELRAARGVVLSVGRGAVQYNLQVPLARG